MTGSEPGPAGELGPSGDLHLIAAALRSDSSDVASYTRVLTTVLGDALPPEMIAVEWKRSLADRMAGRPGTPVRLTVTTDDQELELQAGGRGEIRQVVHGVVIKRRRVGADEWLQALAAVLADLARRSAAARAALTNLLGG
jgi:hypothetical protein